MLLSCLALPPEVKPLCNSQIPTVQRNDVAEDVNVYQIKLLLNIKCGVYTAEYYISTRICANLSFVYKQSKDSALRRFLGKSYCYLRSLTS